jgi:hypothetical protein
MVVTMVAWMVPKLVVGWVLLMVVCLVAELAEAKVEMMDLMMAGAKEILMVDLKVERLGWLSLMVELLLVPK